MENLNPGLVEAVGKHSQWDANLWRDCKIPEMDKRHCQ